MNKLYLIIIDWPDNTRAVYTLTSKTMALNIVKKKVMTFINKIELWELNDDEVTFTLIFGKGEGHEQPNETV